MHIPSRLGTNFIGNDLVPCTLHLYCTEWAHHQTAGATCASRRVIQHCRFDPIVSVQTQHMRRARSHAAPTARAALGGDGGKDFGGHGAGYGEAIGLHLLFYWQELKNANDQVHPHCLDELAR